MPPTDLPPGGQASSAWLHLLRGDANAALCVVEPVVRIMADPIKLGGPWETFLASSYHVDLGAMFIAAGRPDRAGPLLTTAWSEFERMERQRVLWHSIAYLKSRIAASRGDVDGALTLLEQARRQGFRRTWWLPLDPALRALHGQNRFSDLVHTASVRQTEGPE